MDHDDWLEIEDDSLFFSGLSPRFQSSATKAPLIWLQIGGLVKQCDRSSKPLAPFAEFFANRIRRSRQASIARSGTQRRTIDDRVRHAMDREQVVAQFPFPLPAETVDHLDRLQ